MSDDLVKRFRERNVMDYADFDAVVDRIEKLEANIKLQLEWYLSNKRVLADRIEKLDAALRAIIVHCEVPAPPNAEALIMFAQKALEGKDE